MLIHEDWDETIDGNSKKFCIQKVFNLFGATLNSIFSF